MVISVATKIANGVDYLSTVPCEIRLQIFEHLLIINENIYCGASSFGTLHANELSIGSSSDGSSHAQVSITWGILLTCHLYYSEAMPVMYRNNKFVLCSGKYGSVGMFERFPIKTHYMDHLTRLGVFFCADDPQAQSSIRVARFLKALARHARNLKDLEILIDSVEPWNMLFYNHPATEAIEDLVRARTVKQLLIRFHNSTVVYEPWADCLVQLFNNSNQPAGFSLSFALSCQCTFRYRNLRCERIQGQHVNYPNGFRIGAICYNVVPSAVQADQQLMMDVQYDLLEHGLFPSGESEYELWEAGKGLAYTRFDELNGLRQTSITDYFELEPARRRYPRLDSLNGLRQTLITDYFEWV
ncbi:hypothetical protein BU23DRAFT_16821 [Bimuria novae-zelandiae CBS 107.79]|uniref:Uncharacterized protein n=1 Tax=Bimuria novae-zelandiae CBS 107.79 TaxID=1447943 RepID=A0A6A5US59_9PLEO|nr:hypothetical protein BU23DRAFT_16821 [Bimuria novae-zelandiae CBS 107.79]